MDFVNHAKNPFIQNTKDFVYHLDVLDLMIREDALVVIQIKDFSLQMMDIVE